MLYLDAYSAIDPLVIVSAHPCEGAGPSDGQSAIAYLLTCGRKCRRVYVDYPNQAARDTAFAALIAHLRAEQAAGALTLGLDEGETL